MAAAQVILEHYIRLAIAGGGPSALFMFKQLINSGRTDIQVDIFEKKNELGVGMPYSSDGANDEHITNVSGNEIPELVTSIAEWIETAPKGLLNHYKITSNSYNDYKVLPRLVFGQYLAAQFELLRKKADEIGLNYNIHFNSPVSNITDQPEDGTVSVEINGETSLKYDKVIFCTGHVWPRKTEGKVPGYFDSPYPPSKISIKTNEPVAIKGASLTAYDALRTLARANGSFSIDDKGMRHFKLDDDSKGFKLVMHSRQGLLPAMRFHLQDPHLEKHGMLTREQMQEHRRQNDGFISLDYIFEQNFKEILRRRDPDFYEKIKHENMEGFINTVMNIRESVEPFLLFKAEYVEADRSIKKHQSVYWKELLAILSFSMNYPAKYFCAEDYMRLQKSLMPLVAIVIAFVPQSSAEEVMALHDAGVLDIVAVNEDSHIEPLDEGGIIYHYTDDDGAEQHIAYKTFVDCTGQHHLSVNDLPYKGLVEKQSVSPARLMFEDAGKAKELIKQGNDKVEAAVDGNYYLRVPGIAINDFYQLVDRYGAYNPRIYMMAVPYIGGFNPDYSGLDFCEAASVAIMKSLNSVTYD